MLLALGSMLPRLYFLIPNFYFVILEPISRAARTSVSPVKSESHVMPVRKTEISAAKGRRIKVKPDKQFLRRPFAALISVLRTGITCDSDFTGETDVRAAREMGSK